MNEQRFTFPTAGRRFNLVDDDAQPIGDADWAGEAEGRRLGVACGALAVGTVDPVAQVAVTLSVRDREPETAGIERWAFVAEGSFDVPAGRLRVMSGGDGARHVGGLELPPGLYRVRVACDRSGERGVVPGGTETYQIDLWPGPVLSPRVLHSLDGAR
jgi:hypothetical protein